VSSKTGTSLVISRHYNTSQTYFIYRWVLIS